MALGVLAQSLEESFKWYRHGVDVSYWWVAVADIVKWGLKKGGKGKITELDVTDEYLSALIENALM